MRPGLGWQGLENLQKFVREGGVFITVDDTANFAVQFGFASGVAITPAQRLKITGAVLRSRSWTTRAPSPTATRRTCRSTRQMDLSST